MAEIIQRVPNLQEYLDRLVDQGRNKEVLLIVPPEAAELEDQFILKELIVKKTPKKPANS